MTQEVARHRLRVRRDVEDLGLGRAGIRTTGDVADRVAARFARRQPFVGQLAHHLFDDAELHEVVLDVLPRGDVTEAARIPRRDARQRPHLRGRDDALRDLDPQHLDVVLTLPVRAAHEPETPPVFRRDLAALVLAEHIDELVDVALVGKVQARAAQCSWSSAPAIFHLVRYRGGSRSPSAAHRSHRVTDLNHFTDDERRRAPHPAAQQIRGPQRRPVHVHSSSVDAPHTMAARVSGGPAVCDRARVASSSRPASPIIDDQRDARAGASLPAWPSIASPVCPASTRKADASPRCVTGIPASSGAATAVVTPGTTSNQCPRAREPAPLPRLGRTRTGRRP